MVPDNRVNTFTGENLEFFSDAYWLESDYRDACKYNVDWLLDYAKHKDVVVATHPEQWARDTKIKSEFLEILDFPDFMFR